MKLIIAIIQPHCIDPVKRELNEAGVTRLTVMDCQGFGQQEGKSGVLGTEEAKLNLRHKLQLQIAVNEDFVEPTVQAIVRGARTGQHGNIGDGKIFVLPLDETVRVRTGERGPDAV